MSQEESLAETNSPAPSRGTGRRHRGRRGGRGRGPRRTEPGSPPLTPVGMSAEAAPAPGHKPLVPAEAHADASAISRAVDEVMQIIEALKQALGQMEDVLELVEHAERQKLADEHEIESLRRLLRQLQHPRSGRGERREQNA